ncbi:MAG: Nif3-like dinuclear metal center hexameric protein [Streptosporangiales bacterium]
MSEPAAPPPRLRDVVAVIEQVYDPSWAESWDAVGLVCGDPAADVRRVLLAVDPVRAVAAEAADWGADLVFTHHPLFLRPVHGIAADTPKGRVVHDLVRGGRSLYVAHTNADVAPHGVSEVLAEALGLRDLAPLVAAPDLPDGLGLGRIGTLATPEPLRAFTERVAVAVPGTATGIRVTGDPDRPVRTVAICGGAGDSLLDVVRGTAADVYVTADLRHHPVSEAMEWDGPALVDLAHWASEWPWLPVAAHRLVENLRATGTTVETRVSTLVTDPWTLHVQPDQQPQPEHS